MQQELHLAIHRLSFRPFARGSSCPGVESPLIRHFRRCRRGVHATPSRRASATTSGTTR
jgi:hypothetical protein